jgi:hypothetical protein
MLKNQNGLCILEKYGHILLIMIKTITQGTKEDFWWKVIVAWTQVVKKELKHEWKQHKFL